MQSPRWLQRCLQLQRGIGMRAVLAAVLLCGLLGCSTTPEWRPPSCRHDSDDCSPDAVRARVIERFSDVKIQEVLACADEPGSYCSSGEPDHEACLVRLEGEAPAAAHTEEIKTFAYPLIRTLVGNDALRYKRGVYRERSGGSAPAEESIYVHGPGNLAVLYRVEARCFDLSEIT
jgi:hypothetical protein